MKFKKFLYSTPFQVVVLVVALATVASAGILAVRSFDGQERLETQAPKAAAPAEVVNPSPEPPLAPPLAVPEPSPPPPIVTSPAPPEPSFKADCGPEKQEWDGVGYPYPGSSTEFSCTVRSLNGFSGTVSFGCSTLPEGWKCYADWPTMELRPNEEVYTVIFVDNPRETPRGDYWVTLLVSSGRKEHHQRKHVPVI